MGFPDAVKLGFSNFLNFSDRACRSEYWYRVFVITGLCALAVIVTAGLLGRYLPDYPAADGQRQRARSEQRQAQPQDFLNAEKQQQPRHCYHCAISPADLSLSDMTVDGVTITNHSNNMLEQITFEVTMKDCPPGSSPTAANSANRCVIAGQESKRVAVFIPPGQARAFRSQVNFHDLPSPPQGRQFFLWRIVSAKGMGARRPYRTDAVRGDEPR